MHGQDGCLGSVVSQASLCEFEAKDRAASGHMSNSDSLTCHSGNLDLPPYFPFLGKSQLQILSFITSAILLLCHIFTSWAVTERILLRDE